MVLSARIEESFTSPESPEVEPALTQVIHEYGIGIDTHSRFIQVCILRREEDGVRRYEQEFPTSAKGIEFARQFCLKHAPEPLRYNIESTGCYHLPIVRQLGGLPTIVNPMLASSTRRKTDVLDARLLAHQSITGMYPPSYVPTDEQQVLRLLLKNRRKAKNRASTSRARMRDLCLRFGHTVFADGPFKRGDVRAAVEDLARGRARPFASPGIIEEPLPEEAAKMLQGLLDAHDEAEKEAAEEFRKAADYLRRNSWPVNGRRVAGTDLEEVLLSVPGIGPVTSLHWAAHIGDPFRFDHAKKIGAYCGWDPSLKVSAGKVTAHTRRKGNEELKLALLQAAQALVSRHREPLGAWGYRLAMRRKKGGWQKGVAAVGRRLSVALWHCHTRMEKFSYEGYRLDENHANLPRRALEALGGGSRMVRALSALGISNTAEAVIALDNGLAKRPGIGPATIERIVEWEKQQYAKRRSKKRNEASGCAASSQSASGASAEKTASS